MRAILAGPGGFEPPYAGIKTPCLTTWRRPIGSDMSYVSVSLAAVTCTGERLSPLATNPRQPCGRRSTIDSAVIRVGTDANTQLPVPVRRAAEKLFSQSNAH